MYDFKFVLGNIQMDNFISIRKMRDCESVDVMKTWYQFFLQQSFCDITFTDSSGNKTRAHASVLALSSPVFTRLRQHFQNVDLNYFYLCLVGVSSELLNDFLYFVYNGDINIDTHLSPSFLKLANFFGIEMYDNFPLQPLHQEETSNQEEEVIMMNSKTEPNDVNDPLLRSLYQLHLNKILADVIFICSNNEELGAHLTILAMISPYIRSLFNTKQSGSVYIYMVDVSFAVLRTFLEFMYIGIVTIKKQMVTEFLKLAEHFQIKVRTETKLIVRNDTVPTLQVVLVHEPLIERILQCRSPKRQHDEYDLSSDSSTPDLLMKKTRISNTGTKDAPDSADDKIEAFSDTDTIPLGLDTSNDKGTKDVPGAANDDIDVFSDTDTILIGLDTSNLQDSGDSDIDAANKLTCGGNIPDKKNCDVSIDVYMADTSRESPDFLRVESNNLDKSNMDNVQLPGSNALDLPANSTCYVRDTDEETNIDVQNSQTLSTEVDNSSNSTIILIDSQILRQADESQILANEDENNEQDDDTPMNNVEPSVMIIEEDYSLIVLNDSSLIDEAENLKEKNTSTSRGVAEKDISTPLSSEVSLFESIKQEVGSEPPILSQPSLEESVTCAIVPEVSVLNRKIQEKFSESPILTRSRHVISRKPAKSFKKAETHNGDSDSCSSDELIYP